MTLVYGLFHSWIIDSSCERLHAWKGWWVILRNEVTDLWSMKWSGLWHSEIVCQCSGTVTRVSPAESLSSWSLLGLQNSCALAGSCMHWVFLRCMKKFSCPSCCHELFVWNLKEVCKFLLTWDVSPVMSSPTQPHTLKLGHFSSSGSPIKTGKEWNWFNINVPSLKFAEKVLALFKMCVWSPQKWRLYCKCTV